VKAPSASRFPEPLALPAETDFRALEAMEKQGLIERKLYSEHPPRLEYHLTERGRAWARCSARCATGAAPQRQGLNAAGAEPALR